MKQLSVSTKLLMPFFYLLSYIPFFILFLISDFLFFIMYYILKYRRKMVHSNLKRCFPEKTEKEINTIERKFFRHLGDYMIETLKGLSIRKKNLQKRYQFKNPEIFEKYYQQNKSIIIYLGHYGNWEWFSILPFYISHQMCAIYQPQSVESVDHFAKTCRERFGVKAIKSQMAFRELSKYKNKGIPTATLFLGDLRPFPGSTKYWIQFLNNETSFAIGTDRIAKKLDMAVIFPKITKIKRGYYQVEFKLLTDNIKELKENEVIDKFASEIETVIHKQPQYWLWSHNRWKHKRVVSK